MIAEERTRRELVLMDVDSYSRGDRQCWIELAVSAMPRSRSLVCEFHVPLVLARISDLAIAGHDRFFRWRLLGPPADGALGLTSLTNARKRKWPPCWVVTRSR